MSDDKQRVKDAIDIVSYIQRNGVTLKKESRLFVGLCPFHTEKHGSFTVYPETQSYHCFGCHVDGDIFTFAMKRNHWTFPEALEELARDANIQLTSLNREKAKKREQLYALLSRATDFYHDILQAPTGSGMWPIDYLRVKRKIGMEMINAYRLGYAPNQWQILYDYFKGEYTDDELIAVGLCKRSDSGKMYDVFRGRIMIPIRDQKGRVIGFSARAFDEGVEPKYLNTRETDLFIKSHVVHGMPSNQSRNATDAFKTIVLVEGTIDPVSAANRGFYNILALMGKSLSEEQINILSRLSPDRLVFCLDRDDSGRAALRSLTQQHVARLASKGIALYAMFSPHGKDPDDCFREQPELWEPAVNAAQPVVRVLIDLEMAALGVNPSGADKTKLVNHLLPVLKNDNPFIEDENIKTLADRVGIAFDRLKGWAHPQMHVMDKPAPAPKVESIGLPTTEEWVLHGILTHEADAWLVRANSCLLIASDSPMPYALAPLSVHDFTDPQTRRFFEISAKAQAAEQMIGGYIDKSLEALYERIKGLDKIGEPFGLTFDYDVFIEHVYELRLARLQREYPTFEGAKARECAMAIACLQLAAEEMI